MATRAVLSIFSRTATLPPLLFVTKYHSDNDWPEANYLGNTRTKTPMDPDIECLVKFNFSLIPTETVEIVRWVLSNYYYCFSQF